MYACARIWDKIPCYKSLIFVNSNNETSTGIHVYATQNHYYHEHH